MRLFLSTAVTASLALSVLAHRNHFHRHAHLHLRSPAEKRDATVVTITAAGPTVTVYELDGQLISGNEAQQGLSDGEFVVIASSSSPPSPTPTPSSIPANALKQGGQFLEPQEDIPTSPTTSSTSSSKEPAAPSATPNTDPSSTNVNLPFPDGQIPCSQFPAQYGAVPVDYLGLGGWTGLQQTPGYYPSAPSIDTIITGIPGSNCQGPGFCSYACPPGFQKTQWPAAQGKAGQSIGGLFCGPDGMLHLSRPEVPTLCEPGAGGVYVQNDLDDIACTCRTDYPGTESMTIPLVSQPGSENPLTNPNSATYYSWEGMPTTAQYYVNPKGYGPADSCLWNSPLSPSSAGNWAPVNIGTGQNNNGETFLSIFPNLPTSHAVLNFNIEITGDVSIHCTYINGVFSTGSKGCTVSNPYFHYPLTSFLLFLANFVLRRPPCKQVGKPLSDITNDRT